jgi:hypothetical protein
VLRRIVVKAQDCHGEAGHCMCFYCILLRLRLAMTSPSIGGLQLALLPSR